MQLEQVPTLAPQLCSFECPVSCARETTTTRWRSPCSVSSLCQLWLPWGPYTLTVAQTQPEQTCLPPQVLRARTEVVAPRADLVSCPGADVSSHDSWTWVFLWAAPHMPSWAALDPVQLHWVRGRLRGDLLQSAWCLARAWMAESQVPLSSPLITRRNQAAFVRPAGPTLPMKVANMCPL